MRTSPNQPAGRAEQNQRYAEVVPIARRASHAKPVPRPTMLDQYVGFWVAIKAGEVIAASETSAGLAYELQRKGPAADGAVTEYVRPSPDNGYFVGVG